MFKLGKYLQSKGGIPVGGSDNQKLWEVFTARDKPVLFTVGQFWSGDASEYYTLVTVPPGHNLDGTLGMADIPGAIVMLHGNIEGSVGTIASPFSLFGNWQRSSPTLFIVPPDYSVAVMPVTAASANDFGVRLGGFELES